MEKIHTDQAPAAIGPYSQAVACHGVLYTSGQIPIIPETGEIKEGCIRCQTKQVMKNLQAVLEAAGTDFTKVIKSTCFLADINDFAAFNEVYGEFITDKPARSCVAVKDLPKGVKVEVELIADLD
ncbi:RidA family protein [Faecalibaculum rodentium]|jgi:2-iminobutanoate/2-iminopropanoate deaminase|uniref:Regulator n=4 Tax=Faecalibaculum rodentium TaxID=1702221 RepID=A0A1Q9YNN5_9FIRM|nr:RidA family protein [Faecalibaculum rodentium]OLU47465.1 regulator [Faecalibaculum rodentium]